MIEKSLAHETLKQEATPAYKDSALPLDQRVADLVARMNLDEKIAQLVCLWRDPQSAFFSPEGRLDDAAVRRNLGNGIGHIARIGDRLGGLDPARTAALANTLQKFFVEETRLGIPVIFHEECLHGLAAKDGTSYPQPIGLASTFDPALVEEIFTAIAEETRPAAHTRR